MSNVLHEVAAENVVLVVDDVPENLSLLYDALDQAGYLVLAATDGVAALESARQAMPSVILLDALMPGMDGFEVCRRLKADFLTQHIPVIFMTGLTETEHVVTAFGAGGTDYVTKPIKPAEVLARIYAHVQRARDTSQARVALDAFGQATVAIALKDGRIVWQTSLARRMLRSYFDASEIHAPPVLLEWLEGFVRARSQGEAVAPLNILREDKRLYVTPSVETEEGEWLLILREESDLAQIKLLMGALKLTMREAEVLYWVTRGKTNRDIGDILGSSPRTVNKHLEHIFDKLHVETRTAASAVALEKFRGFGGGTN